MEGGSHRSQEKRHKEKQVKGSNVEPWGKNVSKSEWSVVTYHRNGVYDHTELCSVDLRSWQSVAIFRRIIMTD